MEVLEDLKRSFLLVVVTDVAHPPGLWGLTTGGRSEKKSRGVGNREICMQIRRENTEIATLLPLKATVCVHVWAFHIHTIQGLKLNVSLS